MCLLLEKNPDLLLNFPMINLPKKSENENCKIHHYSLKMTDNDQKILQNHLLPNPFHMVDAKFDLVLRPISHVNPAMPFIKIYRVFKQYTTDGIIDGIIYALLDYI